MRIGGLFPNLYPFQLKAPVESSGGGPLRGIQQGKHFSVRSHRRDAECSEKSFGSLKNPAQCEGPDDLHRENGEPSRVEIISSISRRGGLSTYL